MSHRRYRLEILALEELRGRAFPSPGVELARLGGEAHRRARRLWTEVGRGFWTERSDWSGERWRAHLDEAGVYFFVAERAGIELGSFELGREGSSVKLEGFGLLPAWRGHGLGAALLTSATAHAFALGARRVWLETATDDHPHALPNYLARGYRVFHEEALADPMSSLQRDG